MAEHSDVMLDCIRDLDAVMAMRLWKHARPNAPQPDNVYQATAMLHYARTQIEIMPENLRFYSHCWLRDQKIPSGLPDRLKPKAERMYPQMVGAVGIASGKGPGIKTAFNHAVEKVMSDAVLEVQADGHKLDAPIVKKRMMEMRERFKRGA